MTFTVVYNQIHDEDDILVCSLNSIFLILYDNILGEFTLGTETTSIGSLFENNSSWYHIFYHKSLKRFYKLPSNLVGVYFQLGLVKWHSYKFFIHFTHRSRHWDTRETFFNYNSHHWLFFFKPIHIKRTSIDIYSFKKFNN